MTYDAIDDFAGPGGWDEGARMLGLRFIGNEWDAVACLTAKAAGHDRIRCDVSRSPSRPFRGIRGHVTSPPCTLFSAAGTGVGKLAIDILAEGIRLTFGGVDPRADVRAAIYPITLAAAQAKNAKRKPEKQWPAERVEAKAHADAFTASLVLEPARRVMELRPEWLAMEQVPEVLPLWEVYVRELRKKGYSAWTTILCAADYGVHQTRRRAVLGASRVRQVAPPPPTHAEHPQDADLFGEELLPWGSMADCLGWGPRIPARTISAGGAATGGAEPFANKAYRDHLREYVVDRRTNSKAAGGGAAPAVTVPVTRPAPTLTGKSGMQWVIRPEWPYQRPATTIVGSFKPEVVAAPGYRVDVSRQDAPDSVVITVAEAGLLQSFRADYPWTGTKGKQYEQVGNSVPPLFAMHIIRSVA